MRVIKMLKNIWTKRPRFRLVFRRGVWLNITVYWKGLYTIYTIGVGG